MRCQRLYRKPRCMTPSARTAEVDAAAARAEPFQLRLDGWRKFHAVALSDLLRDTEARSRPRLGLRPRSGWRAAQPSRPGATRFLAVSTQMPFAVATTDGCAGRT